MKAINAIGKDGLDVFHIKMEDKKQLKNDYWEVSDFKTRINVPMSVYENKIHTLVIKKMLYRILVYSNLEVKQILEQHGIFGRYDHSFAGEYNEKMKKEIEELVNEKGLNKMEKKTRIKDTDNAIRGSVEFYGTVPTEGFYYSRVGVLRGNVAKEYIDNLSQHFLPAKLLGNLSDVEAIKEHLDFEYSNYLYGEKGPQQLLDYYQKNFIDNFEFGRSILMLVE